MLRPRITFSPQLNLCNTAPVTYQATQALISSQAGAYQGDSLAVLNAISLWANSCTLPDTGRRQDLLRDKRRAVEAFFAFTRKHPGDVTPQDVKRWQESLEAKELRPNTVYVRTSFVSSFYEWLLRDTTLGHHIAKNPVVRARPRAPKAYQTESVKSLTDAELNGLLAVVAKGQRRVTLWGNGTMLCCCCSWLRECAGLRYSPCAGATSG